MVTHWIFYQSGSYDTKGLYLRFVQNGQMVYSVKDTQTYLWDTNAVETNADMYGSFVATKFFI